MTYSSSIIMFNTTFEALLPWCALSCV